MTTAFETMTSSLDDMVVGMDRLDIGMIEADGELQAFYIDAHMDAVFEDLIAREDRLTGRLERESRSLVDKFGAFWVINIGFEDTP